MASGFKYQVGWFRGLSSILFLLALINIAFVAAIHFLGYDLLVVSWFLDSWIPRPPALEAILFEGGVRATAATVVYLSVLAAFLCAIGDAATLYLRVEAIHSATKRQHETARSYGVSAVRHEVTPYGRLGYSMSLKPKGGEAIHGIFPRLSLRMPGVYDKPPPRPIKHKLERLGEIGQWLAARIPDRQPQEPDDALEALEGQLLRVLQAAPETPADLHGYHGIVPLLDHSERVAEELEKISGGHRLSRALGLGHDIGKLLTIRREPAPGNEVRWKRVATNHDLMSAHIVRSLPAFNRLSQTDRDTLNLCLSFSHRPKEVPNRSSNPEQRALLANLKTADGIVTKADRLTVDSRPTSDDSPEAVVEKLRSAIDGLNINQVLDGTVEPDGYTSTTLTYIAVRESAMRRVLKSVIGESMARRMALATRNQPGRTHPSVPAVADLLDRHELLVRRRGEVVSTDGLFRIMVAGGKWHYVWLLRRDTLEKWLPQRAAAWGDWPERLKVLPAKEASGSK